MQHVPDSPDQSNIMNGIHPTRAPRNALVPKNIQNKCVNTIDPILCVRLFGFISSALPQITQNKLELNIFFGMQKFIKRQWISEYKLKKTTNRTNRSHSNVCTLKMFKSAQHISAFHKYVEVCFFSFTWSCKLFQFSVKGHAGTMFITISYVKVLRNVYILYRSNTNHN